MTSQVGSVDRARWMAAMAASMALALFAVVALHQWQPSPSDAVISRGLPAPAPSSTALDPRIATIAAAKPAQPIEAIVQFRVGVSADRARWDVSRVSGHVFAQLHIINALAVKLTAERARWLAANPDVHSVSLNAAVRNEGGPDAGGGHGGPGSPDGQGGPGGPDGTGGPADHGPGGHHPGSVGSANLRTTYNQTLGVTGLWQSGIDGSGVGVAVIDTGVDGALPDFQGANGSRVVESAVTNPGATTATDAYGHGTDVAGIIAGNSNNLVRSNPLRGQYIGVAPGANLISIKVSDEKGNATVLDVIYGLQFAVDHQSDYNIRVVNLSLDSETPQSYTTDPLDAAAEAAWMHGIVVVAAAGNRGRVADAVQYAPANDPYVITVGAVDENGSSNPANDTIASWSSQGTTQDGFHKPDVYAPGAHIVSVLAPGSGFSGMCPSCLVGGQYIKTSGTSMAAPMISGLVADVLQAHPDWTPNQVKGALMSPAVSSNPSLQEVDASKLVGLDSPPVANDGLTPNQLIDPSTGGIDYSRSSWSRSSWSTATGALSAGFARSSWSCTCSTTSTGGIDPSRSSWSRSSWSVDFDASSITG